MTVIEARPSQQSNNGIELTARAPYDASKRIIK